MAQAVVAAFRSLSSSSLTTVAGFLALCVMRLTLGRDIGIVMAKGVVLGVATVILVLPSLVLIFDKQITKHKHKSLMPSFDKVNSFILRHNKVIMVIFVLLFIPAYYAQSHAGIYYKLDESLPRDLPSIVSNEKLKNDFDMATSHSVSYTHLDVYKRQILSRGRSFSSWIKARRMAFFVCCAIARSF